MSDVLAVNGSPHLNTGHPAMVLTPLVRGTVDAGSQVKPQSAIRLKVKPCAL
jgi:hypothetical protein